MRIGLIQLGVWVLFCLEKSNYRGSNMGCIGTVTLLFFVLIAVCFFVYRMAKKLSEDSK